MTIRCECGYLATSPADHTDHLEEMFASEDNQGPDGLVHAEAAYDSPGSDGILICLCGFTGVIDALDQHFLDVFTPADSIGRDGVKHRMEQAAVG